MSKQRFLCALVAAILGAAVADLVGAAVPAPKRRTPRTLEEITIQGEIDVPQVLFITGRPRPFYDDRLHRLYRPTTRQLLAALTTPEVVVVRPVGSAREASR